VRATKQAKQFEREKPKQAKRFDQKKPKPAEIAAALHRGKRQKEWRDQE